MKQRAPKKLTEAQILERRVQDHGVITGKQVHPSVKDRKAITLNEVGRLRNHLLDVIPGKAEAMNQTLADMAKDNVEAEYQYRTLLGMALDW